MPMKRPLYYQLSEYDCGMVTLLNAISYLFSREAVPPDVIKAITTYSLDAYNTDGEVGKNGTSKAAMRFIADWLNRNGPIKGLPIYGNYYAGLHVRVKKDSPLIDAVQQGGAVILRLNYGGEHYVLATKADTQQDYLYLFDPYLDEALKDTKGIVFVDDAPFAYNRKVPFNFFEANDAHHAYALGPVEKREAIVYFNREQGSIAPVSFNDRQNVSKKDGSAW